MYQGIWTLIFNGHLKRCLIRYLQIKMVQYHLNEKHKEYRTQCKYSIKQECLSFIQMNVSKCPPI